MGGSESPWKLSIFSVKPDAPCCLSAAARLPACRAFFARKRFATAPCPIDKYIDAGVHESVIRTTLPRYTLKSHPVNVLLCGNPANPWKTQLPLPSPIPHYIKDLAPAFRRILSSPRKASTGAEVIRCRHPAPVKAPFFPGPGRSGAIYFL